MKKIFWIAFLVMSVTCLAKTKVYKVGSDLVSLTHIFIQPLALKCIEETGIKWNEPLTQTQKVLVEEKKDKTVYTIHINQFEIKPEDGLKLKKVDHLTLEVTPVQTRAGKTQSIKCSLI